MATLTDHYDAIVVGSGAAGSSMAARLAAGGKRVKILEAGADRTNDHLISSTLWARRLKWTGEPVLEDGANPVGHVFNAGRGVGGSAMHHYAVWPRMHPEDFNCRSTHDRGLDWPIEYEDLRPYYDLVQGESGIAGDADQEVWRPPGEAYPMPGVPLFEHGAILKKGFEARGLKTAPLPLAVTSQPYEDRNACIWDGWCDAGCPIGALANPLTIDIPKAVQAGAEIEAEAKVTRILTDQAGDRVTGVEFVGKTGRQEILADLVVLAAFSVENPRLLLASATARHPDGLANSSGSLGRFVTTHPAGLIYGLFDEETRCYMGAFGGQLVNQDGYDKQTHRDAGAFGSYQWMIAQAVKPNDLLGIGPTRADLFGSDLKDFMGRAARSFATMTAVVEDLPVADNRVRLSADRKDDQGVPLAQVTHTTHPESKALWQQVLLEGQDIFKAAGAKEVWTGPQGAMHIMGGTIMGDDPKTSVTNSFGQTHDLPNLVIAGPGLFPTSGGVNPTFTMHAVTARAAAHLLENWAAII